MKDKKNAGNEQLELFPLTDPDEPIPYSLTEKGKAIADLVRSDFPTWKD